MVVDPITMSIIAAAVASGAQGIGSYLGNKKQRKAAKKIAKQEKKNEKTRAKETKRETREQLLEDAMNRGVELQSRKLAGSQKLSKAKTNASQNTADLVREALNI